MNYADTEEVKASEVAGEIADELQRLVDDVYERLVDDVYDATLDDVLDRIGALVGKYAAKAHDYRSQESAAEKTAVGAERARRTGVGG